MYCICMINSLFNGFTQLTSSDTASYTDEDNLGKFIVIMRFVTLFNVPIKNVFVHSMEIVLLLES